MYGGHYWLLVLIPNVVLIDGEKQTLTYMTEAKTWTDAVAVCSLNGGHLYKDNTAETTSALWDLEVIEPWNSQITPLNNFWIGLKSTGDLDGSGYDIFTWSDDCSNITKEADYHNWHPGEPALTQIHHCVFRKSLGSNRHWFSVDCSKHKHYICQKNEDIPCLEDLVSGKCGKQPADQAYMNVTRLECQQYCLNSTGIAYAFDSSSGTCYIYIYFSLFHFDSTANQQTQTGFTLYIRRCYDIAIDTNLYPGVVHNDSDVTRPCVIFPPSQQNTTMTPSASYETTTFLPDTTTPVTTSMTTYSPTTVQETLTTFVLTTTSGLCRCTCVTKAPNGTTTEKELQQMLLNLKLNLTIPKSSLSSTRRKKTCAIDDRVSSTCMGYLAILFLSAIFASVVFPDICKAVRTFNTRKKLTEKPYTINL